nr:dihydroorotate dehydrogenase electron transfer subunit [Jeotgalicoccus pinnipedialis]
MIADNIYKMSIKDSDDNFIKKELKSPGQFVHVRVGDTTEHVLRRPISISEIDKDHRFFTIVYRAEGAGTKVMAKLKAGDYIDCLVPLGNGYTVEALEHVLIVGGGIGVPPLLELVKQFNAAGVKTTHVIGFRSKKDVFYEKEFNTYGKTYVVTEDGSYGHKGFVTHVLEALDMNEYDKFYACGPKVMLSVLDSTLPMPGYISLEERMGCGFGACYACVCQKSDGSQVKLCTDGPVFEKGEILL